MKPIFAIMIVALTVSGTVGCSMCCGPYDFDYPTYGGKHERADRAYGRVGSLFSDPYAGYNGESADSNLSSVDTTRSRDSKSSDSFDADEDIEKFKLELETINPMDSLEPNGLRDVDELPQPDDADEDPTAMRLWKQRPLRSQRSQDQWR